MATRSAGGRRKNQKVITKSHCEVNGATSEQVHTGDVEVVRSSVALIGAGGRSAGARRKAQGFNGNGQNLEAPSRSQYCPASTIVFLSPTLRSFPSTIEEDNAEDDNQPMHYPSPRRSHATADIPKAVKIRGPSLYKIKASMPPSSRLRSASLWARSRKALRRSGDDGAGISDISVLAGRRSQEAERPYVINGSWVRKQGTTLHPYAPQDVPYPICYDTPSLQNDLYADILLSRLRKSSSPTFYDYGHRPPLSVLDLGCGTGLWVLHAAKTWGRYGTFVTGFDVVDLTKGIWPTEGSSKPNYRLVRGNFLLSRLPFDNAAFDVVRMANLATSIPYFQWEHLLEEVKRVLQPGGRLELIDDELCFPGKTQPSNRKSLDVISFADNTSVCSSGSSTRLSTLSKPPSGYRARSWSNVHRVQDEGFQPVHEDEYLQFPRPPESPRSPPPPSPYPSSLSPRSPSSTGSSQPRSSTGTSQPSYTPAPSHDGQKLDSSAIMESLFTNMLDYHLRIHPYPSEFLIDVLCTVFGEGNAELGRVCEMSIAPPQQSEYQDRTQGLETSTSRSSNSRASSMGSQTQPRDLPYPFHDFAALATTSKPSRRRRQAPESSPVSWLSSSPGLMIRERISFPQSTRLLSLPPDELPKHLTRNVQVVLGCKAALADYVEIDPEDGERVFDEEFWDAWCEYQMVAGDRFALDATGNAAGNEREESRLLGVGAEPVRCIRIYHAVKGGV